MEKIEGTVETIVFQSDNKQFCVFRLQCVSLGLVTAVYRGPSPFLGETVQASGDWIQHAPPGEKRLDRRCFRIGRAHAAQPGC